MAATVKRNMWLYSTGDGQPVTVEKKLIAASQGILIPGSILYMSTDGTLKASDTTDASDDKYYGFLIGLEDKSSTWPLTAALAANTKVYVQKIDAADYYYVYVENNDSDATMVQSYVGEEYGLRIATGATKVGYTTMDVNVATAAVHVVDGLFNLEPSINATADAQGIAVVHFVPSTLTGERA